MKNTYQPFYYMLFLTLCLSLINGEEPCRQITKVDAVVPKENKLYLFKYSPWSVQLMNISELKEWQKSGNITTQWQSVTKPQGAFFPVQVLSGQSFNFLVLEGSQKRIWQFDSALQILSSMDLPALIKNNVPEAFQLFWSRDNRFTFVNVAEGGGIQYHETGGKLNLFRKFKLPLSCKQCYQADLHLNVVSREAYPFLCETASSIKLFNSYFSESKTISLSGLTQPENSHRESIVATRPFLVLDSKKKTVLEFLVGGTSYFFNMHSGTFYCLSKD
ncbi:MAG: hypothetical protein HQK83_11035 [Fibrobacteria bacterium]|nr:hypothetical protein [Fibrobacteria bacterium]